MKPLKPKEWRDLGSALGMFEVDLDTVGKAADKLVGTLEAYHKVVEELVKRCLELQGRPPYYDPCGDFQVGYIIEKSMDGLIYAVADAEELLRTDD